MVAIFQTGSNKDEDNVYNLSIKANVRWDESDLDQRRECKDQEMKGCSDQKKEGRGLDVDVESETERDRERKWE